MIRPTSRLRSTMVRYAVLTAVISAMAAPSIMAGDASASASELKAIAKLIEKHGARAIAKHIQTQRRGKVTIEVGGKMRDNSGPPNPKLINARTVARDLRLMKSDAAALANVLGQSSESAKKGGWVITDQKVGHVSGDSGPAATGSPAAAYRGFARALKRGDLNALKSYLSDGDWRELEERIKTAGGGEKELQAMLGMISAFMPDPDSLEVLEENVEGNRATLKVRGTTFMGKGIGTITMRADKGTWIIEDEKWDVSS